MRCVIAFGLAMLVVLGAGLVPPAAAQTKDDTLVYALQSDVQNWDPPNSVLRESIILGYNVFDHLAARDLKSGKVGPSHVLKAMGHEAAGALRVSIGRDTTEKELALFEAALAGIAARRAVKPVAA